jgi:hypothetical protein
MAANVPNPGNYQQQLGQHCVDARKAMQQLLTDCVYVNAMGGAAFLTGDISAGGMGISAPDAAIIMATIGSLTPDSADVQQIQALIAGTATLWGGQ